jgi:DNA-binding response OmpR family regulator
MWRRLARWWKRVTGQGGRVLVVDPSPDAVRLLRQHLAGCGLQVIALSTPEEAVKYVRAVAQAPHAYVIGFRLGESKASGVEAALLLSQERAASRSPFIILHERMGEEALARCRSLLPRGEFIQRPCPGALLRRRVRAAVRTGQRRPVARTSIREIAKIIPPPPRLRMKE